MDSPCDSQPPLSVVIAQLHTRIQSFLEEIHPVNSLLASVQRQVQISLDVVSTALRQFDLSELAVSYNGGKDCLVLLVLFLVGLHRDLVRKQYQEASSKSGVQETSKSEFQSDIGGIAAIYARPSDQFPAAEDFVMSSANIYRLSLTTFTVGTLHMAMRTAFKSYLAQQPKIQAVLVGTRRSDPHGKHLSHFNGTDQGWPAFIRIHLVIDWSYAEIWAFIRQMDLGYCTLYDEGYTSLGGTSDTQPNPKLLKNCSISENAEKGKFYLPAYELADEENERLGRG